MSRLIDRLRLRLASLLSGNRVDASLKSEIELHLQEQIDENIAAGMSPAEARAAAVRAFGPVGLIEEQCRDTRRVAFIENVAQDLRYTLRSLLRQPTLMAAAVLSIAVAVGANTAIFSLASELMFAMPSAQRPDQLVHITMGGGSHVSHRAVAGARREPRPRRPDRLQHREQRQLARTGPDPQPDADGRGRQFLRRDWCAVRVRARVHCRGGAGRARSDHGRDHAIGFWQQRLGGDPAVLGRTLIFNGRAVHRVRCAAGRLPIDRRVRAGA